MEYTKWAQVYAAWEENYGNTLDSLFKEKKISPQDILTFEDTLSGIDFNLKSSSLAVIKRNYYLWWGARKIIMDIPNKMDGIVNEQGQHPDTLQHIENLVLFVGVHDGLFWKANNILEEYKEIPSIKKVMDIFRVKDIPNSQNDGKPTVSNFRNAVAHQNYQMIEGRLRYQKFRRNQYFERVYVEIFLFCFLFVEYTIASRVRS